MKRNDSVRSKMEKLVPLDLSKTNTISEIVDGMSRCSFGARCLGEVAKTLTKWTIAEPRPYIVSDHLPRQLRKIVDEMVLIRWFSRHVTSEQYLDIRKKPGERILVIGNYN